MLAKTTLRLPSPLMEKLRERSLHEGRSLNETAVQALERGLGERVSSEAWLALGSVIEEMPTRRYDPDEFRSRWARLGQGAHRLEDDLDWVRGER